MSYLDNGQIRLGVDLGIGGAVTYLSESGTSVNMINSFDWGRQVQMSFYSGPVPFKPEGATLAKEWEGLGWNPIQAGDTFHHGSRVVAHRNDGRTITVRCVPMIWPLDNVPAESTFECTYRLAGKTVEAVCRLDNARRDTAQYAGRPQELPAVYTNGPWYKLVTYLGDQPFTSAPTTTLVDRGDGKGWPWVGSFAPEHWAALVDGHDYGLGVYNARAYRFSGGFFGEPKGKGGPKDGQCGYIAPNIDEILDHNASYEYRYALIVGTVSEIRRYACDRSPRTEMPSWRFEADRANWTYEAATDAGWPIRGELRVELGRKGAAMVSPLSFWRAEDAKSLRIEAAFETTATQISVTVEPFTEQERRDYPSWGPGSERPPKPPVGPVVVRIVGDGQFRTYEADLTRAPAYRGAMVRLRVLLPQEAGVARVRGIGLGK